MTTHFQGAALNQPKGADPMTTNEELEAQLQLYGVSASLALKHATPAFEELLHLAETRDSGRTRLPLWSISTQWASRRNGSR
jgi:hypothetical protein